MTSPFALWSNEDLAKLIAENPLGWIIALHAPDCATPMPLLLECDDAGKPVALVGHLPKMHPLVAALQTSARALFLFQGPQAYIAPDWLTETDWAPTWNFAVAHIAAEVAFDDDFTDAALRRLVAHMEAGKARPWTGEAMGPRYDTMKARVIGFRAVISSVHARFKLGQDERPDIFGEILEGLGDHPLAGWMRRFSTGV